MSVDREIVPICREAYGLEQRLLFRHLDRHDEEILELDATTVFRHPSRSARFTCFLTGDQNAGKSTFLHALAASSTSAFLRLQSLLTYMSASFINARFCDTSKLNDTELIRFCRDEGPFLDTDIARGQLIWTMSDFAFLANELGIETRMDLAKGDDAAIASSDFVLAEFVEFGGDHLDALKRFVGEEELTPAQYPNLEAAALRRICSASLRMLWTYVKGGGLVYMVNSLSVVKDSAIYWKTFESRIRLVLETITQAEGTKAHSVERKSQAPLPITVLVSRLPREEGRGTETEAGDMTMTADKTEKNDEARRVEAFLQPCLEVIAQDVGTRDDAEATLAALRCRLQGPLFCDIASRAREIVTDLWPTPSHESLLVIPVDLVARQDGVASSSLESNPVEVYFMLYTLLKRHRVIPSEIANVGSGRRERVGTEQSLAFPRLAAAVINLLRVALALRYSQPVDDGSSGQQGPGRTSIELNDWVSAGMCLDALEQMIGVAESDPSKFQATVDGPLYRLLAGPIGPLPPLPDFANMGVTEIIQAFLWLGQHGFGNPGAEQEDFAITQWPSSILPSLEALSRWKELTTFLPQWSCCRIHLRGEIIEKLRRRYQGHTVVSPMERDTKEDEVLEFKPMRPLDHLAGWQPSAFRWPFSDRLFASNCQRLRADFDGNWNLVEEGERPPTNNNYHPAVRGPDNLFEAPLDIVARSNARSPEAWLDAIVRECFDAACWLVQNGASSCDFGWLTVQIQQASMDSPLPSFEFWVG